ncbi:MAG: AAA family ATPase, partial [Thermoplasmata archaeon]
MEEILTYLVDRKKDLNSLDIKERDIKVNLTKEFILTIVGPRRAGKTYFLYHLIKNNLKDEEYLFVNFEEISDHLDTFLDKHREIYGKDPSYIFLDEIQGLPNWEKEVYKIYERKKFFIFITGSSSKLLSKEIATQLRGRSLKINIFPFSFKEILKINNLKKKNYSSEDLGRIKKLLRSCIKEGCFPNIVLKEVEPPKFISELIDIVVFKDIIERYGVENRIALEFFIKNAISSNSNIFSVNKVYNSAKSQQIKVSKNTLYQFQKFLEDVNTIFFLKKYSRSIRKTEASLPKTYVIDNGMYSFTTYKYDFGILMESFVFQELLKHGYEPNKNFFYFSNGYEVDFVFTEGEKIRQLIQVTYTSARDEIEKREIKALLKASEELNCNNLLVIT